MHHISSFLTTPSLKRRFAEIVVAIVRGKMKIVDQSFAPSVAPEQRTHYIKHGIKINDPFAYFERNGDQMLMDWLSSHEHHYAIRSLIMTLDLKPQVDYFAAAYAQLYSVPYKVSDHDQTFTNAIATPAIP